MKLRPASLVVYKQKPAKVCQIAAKKISIEIENGSILSVRPKDVMLLHPGPLENLSALTPMTGEIEAAWEVLEDETFNLETLAEFAYDEFTPSAAWAAWQLVADGIYFQGNPQEIETRHAEQVAAEKEARAAKAAEQAAWDAFLDRLSAGKVAPEDDAYIDTVIATANGQHQNNQVLRALGMAETAENAHTLLLKMGVWDYALNPYPARAGLSLSSSMAPVGNLPDEPRQDLTHLPAFAIDDVGSQDPDDALSWDNGRIWVHIADVAALIGHGSSPDAEAMLRGANLYLPDRTIMMLPPQATQLLALGLNETSPALSFGIDTNDEGEIINLEIIPSWVRVTRFSYEEAELLMNTPPFQPLANLLNKYQARRQQNGAVEIDLPEVKIHVDQGKVKIDPLPKLKSRDLVREAMLMTGEAVATFTIENDIPIPFTIQDAPVGELPDSQSPAAMFAIRRMLKPSQKSTIPGKHHGLGLEPYAQATSPLRRYLDLIVHQQLRAYLRQDELLTVHEITRLIGASTSVIRDVRRVERLSNRHWTCVFLLQHPDWQGEGIVVDIKGRRQLVLLPQLDFETGIYRAKELPLDSVVHMAVNEVDLVHLEASFRETS